jgi:hypothetical protein
MDAYLNGGDAFNLNIDQFKKLYFSSTTLDVLRDHAKYAHEYSIANNPYYFTAVISPQFFTRLMLRVCPRTSPELFQ